MPRMGRGASELAPLDIARACLLHQGMRTALDAPLASLDDQERNFVTNIAEHGWFGTHVAAEDEGPDFSFTTGFWLNLQFPEIIVFSLKGERAHNVLWHVFREIKEGRPLAQGMPLPDIFSGLQAMLLPVAREHYDAHLGWSRWFYGGDDFPCLQLVWPDRNGIFPWQPGFAAEFEGRQPDLTERGWAAALAM